jgi:RNA polymerase sigma-70 factor (ECF subfamily)
MPEEGISDPGGSSRASDGTLVARVLKGDCEAYSCLVLRHQEGLFRYACGLGVAPDPARDLVQESFLRAYDRLSTLADPDRFEVWLFRILRNGVFDLLKGMWSRSVSLEHVVLPDPGPAPDAAVMNSELRVRLTACLDTLRPELKEAFLLKHLQELSYGEMSEITGASVSALKMRVLRAREILREAFVVQDHAESDVTSLPPGSSVWRKEAASSWRR